MKAELVTRARFRDPVGFGAVVKNGYDAATDKMFMWRARGGVYIVPAAGIESRSEDEYLVTASGWKFVPEGNVTEAQCGSPEISVEFSP